MYLIGASSLNNTFGKLHYEDREIFFGRSYAISGLSFNESATFLPKKLQFLLNNGRLRRAKNIIIWHDIINNSLTPHNTNKNRPCSIPELIEIILQYKNRISGIVYCQRTGAPNILQQLKETEIPIIDAKTKLISTKNQRKERVLRDLARLHPSFKLESKFLWAIWNRFEKLAVFRKRINRNKPGQKERNRKKKQEQKPEKQKKNKQGSKQRKRKQRQALA